MANTNTYREGGRAVCAWRAAKIEEGYLRWAIYSAGVLEVSTPQKRGRAQARATGRIGESKGGARAQRGRGAERGTAERA